MKNLTIKQVAFFSVLFFGWALVAGAQTNVALTVTTSSGQDALTLGIQETITPNVGTLGSSEVSELDVYLTSIGGTYLNGANPIPSTTGINQIAGTWTIQGGVAYLASTTKNGTSAANPIDQAGSGSGPLVGGAANVPASAMDFDTAGPSPSFGTTGGSAGTGLYTYAATTITGDWYTTWQNCNIFSSDPTPGGTWNYNGGSPTGYGFNNTLLAAFYVSPTTTGAEFYTTDGNAWNGSNSGQFGFNYGGGRTDYVSIVPQPEPTTIVLLATGLVGLLAYAWRKRR